MKKRRSPISRESAEKFVEIANALPLAQFDIDHIFTVVEYLRDGYRAPKQAVAKPTGRPGLSGSDYVHIWAVIEAQWRIDRGVTPGIRLRTSIGQKLQSLPRRGNGAWRIMHDLGPSRRHIEIRDKDTGRRYHSRGARLVKKMHPAQRLLWEGIVTTLMAGTGTKRCAK